MHTEDYDIETIEQYLNGQLDAELNVRFETQLAQDEVLQSDTAQYRRLFDGFGALRSQAFGERVSDWEAELQFTENQTGYAPLLDGLAALRSEALREQMAGWEKVHTTTQEQPQKEAIIKPMRPSFVRRWAVAATILVLVGAGLSWYATQNYSSDSLAESYYRMPNIGNTMGNNDAARSEIENKFAEAHRLMNQKAYREALPVFDEVLLLLPKAGLDETTIRYYSDNAEWNRALALLATEGASKDTRAALDTVLADAQSEYQPKAEALLEQLNSWWYGLARRAGK